MSTLMPAQQMRVIILMMRSAGHPCSAEQGYPVGSWYFVKSLGQEILAGPYSLEPVSTEEPSTVELSGPSVIVKLPPRFYWDHTDRDLPAGRLLRTLASKVEVELDQASYDELMSDADHYAQSGVQVYGQDLFGLVMSAKATCKALAKAGRP